jgi:hypothetical protein
MQKNTIEVEEEALGFYDEPDEYYYLDALTTHKTFIKPYGADSYNKNSANMIYYWNIVMIKEAHLNQRVRYTIMDILGELGGVFEGVWIISICFFYVYNYK